MTASAGGAGSGSGAGAAGGGDFGGGDYFVSSAAAGKSAGAITSETSSDAAVEGLDGVAPRAARQQLAVALVCACNMNRSMAAHKLLVENGFTTVESFGCARQVKLPGGPSKALCFDWGTPYTDIEATLRTGDERSQKWLAERRIFDMVTRNRGIKRAPERWQRCSHADKFDLVVCFEERVFDTLIADIQDREPQSFQPVHVVNLEVKDTTAAAVVGAKLTLRLAAECARVGADGMAMDMDEVLARVAKFCPGSPQYFLHYL